MMLKVRGFLLLGLATVGCGSNGRTPGDANPDVAIDASCQPMVLLAGGTDAMSQGWATVMLAPASLTYGPDYVRLQTSTAGMGGQLLLTRAGSVDLQKP